MASIDSKVVQMQFDNAAFERKMSTTLQSLQKLNDSVANIGKKNGLDSLSKSASRFSLKGLTSKFSGAKAGLDQMDQSAKKFSLSGVISKFTGAKRGIDQMDQSARKFSLAGMTSTVEGMSGKFLALSTVAVTALATITAKAVSAGVDMAKGFSLDPILQGFSEYELQIGSIQTILANTASEGTKLSDVSDALNVLNEYADRTIYNFGEMTKNIGTFTAAGVDLETSVQSIKGIANLAAISGSNSQQASTAMYQLSQAMAAGTVKLMDWNSVVNAGMGGKVFQKALFDTGVTMGTIADVPMGTTFQEWTDAGNTFRGSLEQGWLTSEVLTTTLQGFTGEMTEAQLLSIGYTKEQAAEILKLGQTGVEAATKVRTLTQLMATIKEAVGSGWSETFRIIVGDFKDATLLWTDVSDAVGKMVGDSADARNEMLKGWADFGGRTALIKGLRIAFHALGDVFGTVKKAFRDVFPPLTAERLLKLTESFVDFTKKMRPSKETLENLRTIFKGFFGVLEIGWEIIKQGTKFVVEFFKSLTGAGSGGFLKFLASIGSFFVGLNKSLVKGGGIKRFFKDLSKLVENPREKIVALKDRIVEFFQGIVDAVKKPKKLLTDFKDALVGFFDKLTFGKAKPSLDAASDAIDAVSERFSGFKGVVEKVKKLWGPFGKAIGAVGERFSGLKNVARRLQDLWEPLGTAIGAVAGWLDDAWEGIKTWFSDLGQKLADVMKPGDFDKALDVVNTGLLGGLLLMLRKFLKGGLKLDFGGGFLENLSGSFEQLTGVLTAMQADLKSKALLKIAAAIGIITLSLVLLASINSGDLTRALTAMSVGFAQLVGAFALMNKVIIGPKAAATMSLMSFGMIALAGAMLVLSLAVKLLAGLSWEELIKGLGGVVVLLAAVSGAAIILSKSKGGLVRTGLGLMVVAVAINLLALAVRQLSGMSWTELAKGLGSVVVLLGALSLAAVIMGKAGGGLVRAGISMVFVAVALNILALAVRQFASFEWGEMIKGLAGVGVGLGALVLSMRLMPPGMALQGLGLIAVAVALNILALAVRQFATFSWSEMAKGFVGIAGGLVIIALAMKLMPLSLPITAAGLLLVAAALNIIAGALLLFGTMSWSDIGRGLVAMAGALLALALATNTMNIGGAIALGIISGALVVLTGVLISLSKVPTGELIKALLGLAAVMLILGLTATVMAPLAPALLGLGVALLLVGAGFALFGVGAAGIAKAFEIIAKTGTAGIKVFVGFIDAIIKKLPALIKAFAKGLLQFVQVFIDAAPVIVKGLVVLLEHIIDGIITLLPKIATVIGDLISIIIQLIKDKVPELIDAGLTVLLAFLHGIEDNIGEIVTTVANIITGFLDALAEKVPEIIDSVYNLIVAIIEGVAAKLVDIGSYFLPKGLELLGGLLTGMKNKVVDLKDWLFALPGKIPKWLGSVVKTLWTKGIDLIAGLLRGIVKKAPDVIDWFKSLPGKILDWVGDVVSKLTPKGTQLIAGLIRGVIEKAKEVTTWFKQLPGKIFDWIGDVSDKLLPKGLSVIGGLLRGAREKLVEVKDWFISIPGKIPGWIGLVGTTLWDKGLSVINGLWAGAIFALGLVGSWIASIPSKILGWIPDMSRVLWDAGLAVIGGLWEGMKSKWEEVTDWLSGLNPGNWFNDINMQKGHAEKNLVPTGNMVMQGLRTGLEEGWIGVTNWLESVDPSESMKKDLTSRMTEMVATMASQLENMSEFNPTITPVLDLTRIQADARNIGGIISSNSHSLASNIASSVLSDRTESANESTPSGGVKFEQNIYAPKQLSTSDIYRQTRNQITMAKEELNIP